MVEIVFGRSAYGTMKYIGISPTDLYCFSFGLSMGNLQKIEYPDLSELKNRLAHGESLRLWYSQKSPEESCGFHWLMAQLKDFQITEICTVCLPDHFSLPDGCIMICTDWGEVEPERWKPLLEQKNLLPAGQRVCAAMRWQELEKENAPLRAVVNGSLVSVPADFYDHFIQRELEKQPAEFREANLIGTIMNHYQLGIGDNLLHARMNAFIQNGLLEIISPAENGKPDVRRTLRKVQK